MAQPETEVALRERLGSTPPPAWHSSAPLTVEDLEELF
jgi:hypothetical protein